MAHRPGLQVFRSLWGCDSHLPFRALESIGERLSLLKVCVCVAHAWGSCVVYVRVVCVCACACVPPSLSLSLSLFVSPFTLDSLTDQLTNDHPSPSLYPLPLPSPSTPSL